MQLKFLSLVYFQKHETLDMDFTNGLTAIVGPNDAGKSTILRAILYALAGTAASGVPAKRIWTRNAIGKGSVSLDLDLPGYPNCRITRKESGAELMQGGVVLAAGHTPVTKFVEERMGMTWQQLRSLMYSKQKETQGLLDEGAAKLQRRVEDLAGVTTIDRILSLVSDDMKTSAAELAALGEGEDLDALATTLAAAKKKAEATQEKLMEEAVSSNAVRASLERSRQCQMEAKSAKDKEAETERVYRKAVEQYNNAVKAYEEANNNEALKASPDVGYARAHVKATKDSLAEIEEAYKVASDLELRAKRLHSELELLPDGIGEHLALVRESMEKAVLRQEAAIRDWEASVDAWTEASHTLRVIKEKFDSPKDCPECGRPFDVGHVHVTKDEVDAVAERVKEAANARELATIEKLTAKKVWQQLEKEETEWQAKLDRHKHLRDELLATALGIKGLPFSADILGTRLEQGKRLLAHDESRLEDAIRKEAERKAAEATLGAAMRARTKASSEQADAATALRKAAEAAEVAGDPGLWEEAISRSEAELERITAVVDGLRFDLGAEKAYAAQAEERLKEATAREESRKVVGQKSDKLSAFQKYLKNARGRLMQECWDGLLATASAHIEAATGGELGGLRREDDQFLFGNGTEVEEHGESMQSLVGLSLRLAMSQVFYGHGLPALLDEVTSDADDEVAAAVAGVLTSLGTQVIYVTHRTGDAVNSDNVMEIR